MDYTFDRAVAMYGRYVEGKLSETDKKGKPKHKLDDILKGGIEQSKKVISEPKQLLAMFGHLAKVQT